MKRVLVCIKKKSKLKGEVFFFIARKVFFAKQEKLTRE